MIVGVPCPSQLALASVPMREIVAGVLEWISSVKNYTSATPQTQVCTMASISISTSRSGDTSRDTCTHVAAGSIPANASR